MSNHLPVQLNERSPILDILRGFALLGIFLNNCIFLGGYQFLPDEVRAGFPTAGIDKWVMFLQSVFVEGKFYTIFSLLFGIGFSIILIRNEQRGTNALGIFYRRLFILAIIGLLHLLLLWNGDILLLYALIGMLLPLFRKCSDKALLIWAACLILSPILFDFIKILAQWSPGDWMNEWGYKLATKNGIQLDENFPYYLFKPSSGYHEIINFSQPAAIFRYQYILDSNRIPKVLGIFLLGLYAGRRMMYIKLEQNYHLLRAIQRRGFLIGIPASIAMAYFEGDDKNVPGSWMGLVDTVTYALGVVPLGLAYVASVCLWWMKNKHKTKLTSLAPVGRMAMTNYLMQTILSIIIFYGIGFAVGTTVGYSILVLIVLAIFILQIIYSNLWFKYFNYGPFEWIWRQLTYGKRYRCGKEELVAKREREKGKGESGEG